MAGLGSSFKGISSTEQIKTETLLPPGGLDIGRSRAATVKEGSVIEGSRGIPPGCRSSGRAGWATIERSADTTRAGPWPAFTPTPTAFATRQFTGNRPRPPGASTVAPPPTPSGATPQVAD